MANPDGQMGRSWDRSQEEVSCAKSHCAGVDAHTTAGLETGATIRAGDDGGEFERSGRQ